VSSQPYKYDYERELRPDPFGIAAAMTFKVPLEFSQQAQANVYYAANPELIPPQYRPKTIEEVLT
jgi:hypothetical protein